MKDVSTILRTKYISALGSITDLAGNTVSVYDRPPSTAGNMQTGYINYINFGGFTSNEWTDKTGYGQEVTITVNVWCYYNRNAGGQKEIDYIGDQITQAIRTRGTLDLSPNHDMITVTVDNILNTSRQVDGGVEYLKAIRFRHLIKQV